MVDDGRLRSTLKKEQSMWGVNRLVQPNRNASLFSMKTRLTWLAFVCATNLALAQPAREVKSQDITLGEARAALNTLVEKNSFLSNDPFLEPLKSRIKEENKKESLLEVPAFSAYKGNSLGYWHCDYRRNDFSYIAKSASAT